MDGKLSLSDSLELEELRGREPPVVDGDWAVDPANPRNWPLARKTVSTAVVTGIGFVSTMAASIYAPGHEAVAKQFGVSTTLALLPLSFFNLGMALGPIISSPMSETYGRKAVYFTTIPTFALFVLGSGFSQSLAALTVCRFFSGVFASPGVSIASATISDMAAPVERAVPLALYYSMPFIGSLLGPLIGGFVVEKKGWRWTMWTILFFNLVCLSSLVFVRESYRKTLLRRRAKARGLEGPPESQREITQEFQYFITKTVIRPVHMLFTEPIVGFVCIYSSFQFALLYTFVVASPYVFSTVYGFSLGAQGLTFLGFIIGCSIAPMAIITLDRLVYKPKFLQFQEAEATKGANANTISELPPEHRLYCSMIGSIVLPTGLFWFAWTAKPSVHWICPIIAQAFSILGSVLVYVGANFYMLDTYGPLYGASAAGATSLSRYTLATAFPLFTLQMYRRLGIGWATSLLGFCTLAMAPIPWVFYRWGPKLRARSKYEHEN